MAPQRLTSLGFAFRDQGPVAAQDTPARGHLSGEATTNGNVAADTATQLGQAVIVQLALAAVWAGIPSARGEARRRSATCESLRRSGRTLVDLRGWQGASASQSHCVGPPLLQADAKAASRRRLGHGDADFAEIDARAATPLTAFLLHCIGCRRGREGDNCPQAYLVADL
jgi:hypothetical protein